MLVLFSLSASLLDAQTTTRSITGLVTDQTGAILPHAAVSVSSVDTGVMRRVLTNEAGVFNAPDLIRTRYPSHGSGDSRGGALEVASTSTETQVVGAASVVESQRTIEPDEFGIRQLHQYARRPSYSTEFPALVLTRRFANGSSIEHGAAIPGV